VGECEAIFVERWQTVLPVPPPAIGSDEYKKALAEVNELGENKSTKRTADQTHIAQFYKQDAELTVNEGARQLAISTGLLLSKMHLSLHWLILLKLMPGFEIWGGKYKYLAWRPVTA